MPVLTNFYPLLVGGGTNINSGANVVPDWPNDKIYTWGPPVGVTHTLWTSRASDGTLLSTNTVLSVCGISSNTFIVGSAIVLGTDGTHIYAMTSHGTIGTDKQNNLRLSKIDTATMMEVAAYVPYAITNKVAEGYFISGAGDWRLSAFRLAGVDYLALLLNGSDPANIEIIGTAALSSVVTYNYTTQGGADVHMVVGERPTGSTQKLYLMQDEPNGDATQIGFVATTFNNAPSIADVLIRNVLASDIDATWTGTFPDVEVRGLDLMFCSTDASLVFAVLDDISSGPNLPPLTKVVKIDSVGAVVAWTVTVSNTIFNLANTQFSQAAALADLSQPELVFCDPNSNTYYTITLATGAFTSATSPHFDGTVSDNGVRYPAVWDSVRERFIYYYEGTNDLSPAWAQGGWAVIGPSSSVDINLVGVGGQGVARALQAGGPQTAPPAPPVPCTLQDIIPSYLYQEYNDDDDLQAFVRAYNSYAQAFLDWFNELGLPIYTTDPIKGLLLDWVAEGLYGITRPALITGTAAEFIGPYDTWDYDALGYDEFYVSGGTPITGVSDDIFRRVITWHFYKGDCKVFDIRWLKRRIMRFLLGTNGTDFNVDQTYQVSVTFGPGNQVNINLVSTTSSFLSGALYDELEYDGLPEYDGFTSSIVTLPPLPNGAVFKEMVDAGYLELPFQFTYRVNLI